jgi:thymidylate synthase
MNVNVIVAFDSNTFGIGIDNRLPWDIPDDLKRFSEITNGSIVVMGHRTWLSIPEGNRPLKGRCNVVVTTDSSLHVSTSDMFITGVVPSVVYVTLEELDRTLNLICHGSRLETTTRHTMHVRPVYIIGGAQLYKKYVGSVDRIYATLVDSGAFGTICDTFFPICNFDQYFIETYGPLQSCGDVCKVYYRYVTYKKRGKRHEEYGYLDLLKTIRLDGSERPDRTGVGTRSIFAPNPLRFDLSKGFPLVTTRFMGWKMVVKELLWFLRGQTDSKVLEAQGVNIWKRNTTREFLCERGLQHYREGDIGPMYGWIWRNIGAEYRGCDASYMGHGIDQIERLLTDLKVDPYSRRHILTTYCPLYVDQGCLMPCHGIVTQFYVSDKHLSCHVYNRSQDVFLGMTMNIASYALLTCIIAKKADMIPGELVVSSGDSHLYLNHLVQADLQLLPSRVPLPFPVLEVNDAVRDKNVDDITLEDFNLVGYLHHPAIKAEMAV